MNEVLDHLSEVPSTAVFHVNIEILRCFEMFPVVVGDNDWMAQGAQDREFGVKLLSFFLRHLDVIDFLAAENLKGASVELHSVRLSSKRTWPSDFRLTFLITPKDPCPVQC